MNFQGKYLHKKTITLINKTKPIVLINLKKPNDQNFYNYTRT